MNQNDSHGTVSDQTVVKDLFGLVLEAEDTAASEEARAALEAAEPAVRDAVQRLLSAHRRAAGMLLEDKPGPVGPAGESTAFTRPHITGYEIHDEIGRGGFGVVYRAEQMHRVQRPVAIKILRTELATQNVIARFKGESRVLAKMNHPGIARVLDAGLDSFNRPFLAMELVEGEPLVSYCETHQLSVRQRVQLMADVCEAVHHAHQRAVIHRDLKPANILVEQVDGRHRPRVIDFGIAKLIEEDSVETRTQDGAKLGTPRYMSPEQSQGTDVVDVRADVYALGVLLCEALTGQVPRDPAGTESRTGSKPKTRATRPSKLAAAASTPAVAHRSSELRGDLDRIVLKAVALEPDGRYESAAALGEDLKRYLDGRAVQATPPNVLYLTSKFIARHKVVSGAVALSVLSLIGGTIGATYGLARAHESRVAAELALIEAQRERNRAEAVAEFLLGDMLDAMNPDLTGNGEPDVRVLLRNSAREAEKQLAGDGELLVDVLTRVGKAMRTLTDFEAAADALEQAAARSIELAGPTDRRSLELRIDALIAALSARRFDGAIEAIAEIRADAEMAFGPTDPIALRARLHQAHIIPQDDVAQVMRDVLDELEDGGHLETAVYLETLRYLGSAMYFANDPDAMSFLARGADLAARRYGQTNSLAIELRSMTANAAYAAGELEFAQDLLREIAQTTERLYGPANWYRFRAVGILTRIALAQEDLPTAIELARSHLQIAIHRGVPESEMYARTWLAEALLAMNRYDEIEEILAPVLDSMPPGHMNRTNAAMLRAKALGQLQGSPIARDFLETERGLLPEGHPHQEHFKTWLAEYAE